MGVANPLVAELDCVAIFSMRVNFTNSIHRVMFNDRKNMVGNWRVELTVRLFDADGSALAIHAGVTIIPPIRLAMQVTAPHAV